MQLPPSIRLGGLSLFLAVGGLSPLGCAASSADAPDEVLGDSASQPIIGGQAATSYAEAALITTSTFICSGAVIAPRVVLTAGHCVTGASKWTVTTPFAGGQRATSAKPWTDYVMVDHFVNPRSVDVGILVLDAPINLPSYPSLAAAPVSDGTMATNVGRIQNGRSSNTSLFFGREVPISDGESFGFPLAYVSREIIESGDSGGPVYVKTPAGRQIVAVNSGAGGGTQTLARIDLVKSKIDRLIHDNGGSVAPPPPPPPVATCSGTTESEPNDDPADASPMGRARCGTLTAGDVDWFTWKIVGVGVSYDVQLDTAGDAELLMWKHTWAGWQQIERSSTTQIAARSGGSGTYVFAVRSPSGSAQPYRVTLAK